MENKTERRMDYLNYDDIHNSIMRIEVKVDQIDIALRGNGKPGINTRIDRLEIWKKTYQKVIWVLMSTVLATVATRIIGLW